MSDKCPYCGTFLTSSLKFCVSCRRSVTDDQKNVAGSAGFDDPVGPKSFKLSKKEYSAHRAIRSFFFASSTVLMLVLVFFVTMKYILHKPVPGEEQLTAIVRQIMSSTRSAAEPR